MIIKEIQTEILKISLKTPFITALRRVENVEFVRMSIECENGDTSFGEAPATKAITGEDLESITNAIETNKELFYGLSPHEAIKLLHTLAIGSSVKACIDMALYALLNHSTQAFLEYGDEAGVIDIQTAITISLNEKNKMCEDANLAYESGLNTLKLKFGDNITHAIEVTKSITSQNPDAKILIDANQAWNFEDTKEFVDAIKNIDIELIEQPLIASDLEGLQKITEYSHIPIVADETCFTFEDVKRVVQSKSADIINIKLMKCGGITKAIEILEYCKSKNTPVMFGSMLEGPISISYAYWLVSRYMDVVKYIDLDSPLLYKELS